MISTVFKSSIVSYFFVCLLFVLGVWCFTIATSSVSAADMERWIARFESNKDVYLAWGDIFLDLIEWDAFVAWSRIVVDNALWWDMFAAANTVMVSEAVADDVRIAAGNVIVSSIIGWDLIVFGSDIVLQTGSVVSWNLIVFGWKVRIAWQVVWTTYIRAERIDMQWSFGDDVDVHAEKEFLLAQDSNIVGDLTYVSYQEVMTEDIVSWEVSYTQKLKSSKNENERHSLWFWFFFFFKIIWFLFLLIAGWLLLRFLPKVRESLALIIKKNPTDSGLMWLAVMVGLPVVSIALMISIIWIPVWLVWFALYAILWLTASVLGVVVSTKFLILTTKNKLSSTRSQILVFVLLCALFTLIWWLSVVSSLFVWWAICLRLQKSE